MGCFAIKTIIINHILNFKKVLKKCENWQKNFLILLPESQFFLDIFWLVHTNFAPSCTWKFGMSTWPRANLKSDNWKLVWDTKVSKMKSLYFPPFFLIIEFGQIKQKVENGSCSIHSCVNQHDFKCMYTNNHLEFGPNKINFKIHILPIYEQTDLKTAIV